MKFIAIAAIMLGVSNAADKFDSQLEFLKVMRIVST